MSWLKFDTATPEKPEVFSITIALGWEDPDLTVGKLLKVWRWFDHHSLDGNASGVTLSLLDRLIGVAGLSQAMVDVGWLEVSVSGLTLPNFENHNGKTAKDRALTAKRAAGHRINIKCNDKSNACSVTNALPREEKRREDTDASHLVGRPTVPNTPVQKIVDLYNELMPELPAAKLITEKRKRDTPKFWRWVMTSSRSDGTRRAETAEQGIDFIRNYFKRAKENDFVMGRTPKAKGHEGWEAGFDFLISEAGRIQVVEKTR